jgi:hypothetical protein
VGTFALLGTCHRPVVVAGGGNVGSAAVLPPVSDPDSIACIVASADADVAHSSPAAPAAPVDLAASRSTRRRRSAVGLLLAALMLLPCVTVVACLAGRPWWPVLDLAIIDLRVRDVWSLHPPLTGQYSRTPWNHPGPLMFWLMALVSGPARGAPWATRIGGAVLQGAALAWLAWLSWRRGLRTLLAAAAVTAGTFSVAQGVWLLREPWNPYVPVGCFVLFLFLTAFVARGSFRLLIAMVFVGSFVVQAHVSYTLLVLAGLAWAIGCTLVDASRRGAGPPQWRSTVLLAAGVGLACWIGPVIDVVTHWSGNLTRLARYFANGHHAHVGLAHATKIMATEFRVVPPWLGGHEPITFFTGYSIGVPASWLLVAAVLLVGGALAARANGSRDDARLVGLAGLMVVTGIVAISGADVAYPYTYIWRVTVAVFVVVASMWPMATFAARRLPVLFRHVGSTLVVGTVAAASVTLALAIPSARVVTTGREKTMRAVAQQIDRRGLPTGTLLLRTTGEGYPSIYRGLFDYLARRGVDVRADVAFARALDYRRTAAPSRAHEVWYVTETGSFVEELERVPGASVVASTTPLRAQQEAELSRLQGRLWAEIRQIGRPDLLVFLDNPFVVLKVAGLPGIDIPTAARAGQLNSVVSRSAGCRCAVIAVPSTELGVADQVWRRA